ncbi:MAG: helix-turn-helix domain-containing protein [Nonomuraea sp.]|nr:helix-turn-helix domain-containing protein [Nonomuraea sp.]NUP68875.1 helix-turn-helix domain-containing protein [Nonomuraea sp.]NUP76126.1 helix-turn-helix domain-containing protein [Nonomuraea sp.]NUS06439.1 helix-turn-helix domain-containing protein [Nonomuraea sp.]NUT12040.1 helix-turn-helix domain-containing protein [Nonomuraea sp.]
MNRDELAEFLRSRRARVTPSEVGLPSGGQRRTPGLRRQEVAQLAGMSIDYYIRLEQGRGPHPSRQVLSALGRALMLGQDERAHLFRLAGQTLDTPRIRHDVPQSILHLIAFMEEVPAYVLDARYDIRAWNPLASALIGGLECRPPEQMNVIRWVFTAPDLAEHLGDEEKGRFARASVADLRVAAGRYPDDRALQALVAEMMALSPCFAELWSMHEVEVRREQRKRVIHPVVGVIDTICQVLPVPDRDDLRLVLYTTEPGSPSHQALRDLRRLTLSS